MEYLFDWVIPLWLASWIFVMWQIYIPAIALVRELDDEHIVYKWRYLTFLIWSVLSMVCVPLLMIAALGERYRQRFIISYVKNLMDRNER